MRATHDTNGDTLLVLNAKMLWLCRPVRFGSPMSPYPRPPRVRQCDRFFAKRVSISEWTPVYLLVRANNWRQISMTQHPRSLRTANLLEHKIRVERGCLCHHDRFRPGSLSWPPYPQVRRPRDRQGSTSGCRRSRSACRSRRLSRHVWRIRDAATRRRPARVLITALELRHRPRPAGWI